VEVKLAFKNPLSINIQIKIMSSEVFEVAQVGGIEVKNRIIRSATQEIMAIDRKVTNKMIDMYEGLAKGGVGLIITGYFTFSKTDNQLPSTISIENDEAIPLLKVLVEKAHSNGTKIVAQLAHQGSQILQQTNEFVYGPSEIVDPFNSIKPKALKPDQIEIIVNEFGKAALRAQKAGFDGVQIHAAHGYLLSKFLSPFFNKRTDQYGGSPEKNTKIVVDILKEIKCKCGKDFPVWIKLNSEDFGYEQESLSFESTLLTSKILDDQKIDAIELSGGTPAGKQSSSRSIEHEAYHYEYAIKLSSTIDTPVFLVGGCRDIEKIESILCHSNINAVSLSRALIREPEIINRWKNGDSTKAKCVACNGCFNLNGVTCIFNLNEEKRKAQQIFLKQLFS